MFKILCGPSGTERRPGYAISDHPKSPSVNVVVTEIKPNGERILRPVLPDYYILDAPPPTDG